MWAIVKKSKKKSKKRAKTIDNTLEHTVRVGCQGGAMWTNVGLCGLNSSDAWRFRRGERRVLLISTGSKQQ